MRSIDLPPVWLAGAIVLAWVQSSYYAFGFNFGGVWADFAGGILVGGGVILMVLAISEMRRQRTTIIPHQTPSSLVQSGIFSKSRNPIYLGDALLLLGLILRFDAVLALPLLPIFVWILEKRFVIPEENRLRRTFRADWGRYEQKVRRWI